MTIRSPRWLGFGPIALLVACAQAGPAAGGEAPTAGAVGPPKTIVIAQLAPTTSFGPWQFSNTGGGQAPLVELHTQGLTGEDSEGRTTPRLIAKMPSFEDGTVTVLADGRMRTTLRLRSDVTWQDGVPFSTEDVVFSYLLNKLTGEERSVVDAVARRRPSSRSAGYRCSAISASARWPPASSASRSSGSASASLCGRRTF